jgi:hypothetical protein
VARGQQRNRGFFGGIVRGVSIAREGLEILPSSFSPDWCAELAPTSPKLVEEAFCEVRHDGILRRALPASNSKLRQR